MVELSKAKYGVRVWKNATGTSISMDGSRIIKFGMPGASDILGIMKPAGRLLAIECKTGSGKLSHEQQRFRDLIESYGGLYIEARSLDSVLSQLLLDPWSSAL